MPSSLIPASFLSARPVRAATRRPQQDRNARAVSIRATRAGRDPHDWEGMRGDQSFYPRDPCGPRPRRLVELRVELFVSIRATRAGRDARRSISRQAITEFLSARPVRAATRRAARRSSPLTLFLSARPVRAATPDRCPRRLYRPRFYPRDPCGPRPGARSKTETLEQFLSARPVRAATRTTGRV